MRHDTWRREAASCPLYGELLPRYADVDAWQHPNNTALISMHGEAVQQATRGVFGARAWRHSLPVLACGGNATDFLAEAHHPATPPCVPPRCPGAETVDPLAAPIATAMPDLAHFLWRTMLAIRFADSDARRLASDTCLARCTEQARVEFLNHVFAAQPRSAGGMMVAHVSLRWLHRGAVRRRPGAVCTVSSAGVARSAGT